MIWNFNWISILLDCPVSSCSPYGSSHSIWWFFHIDTRRVESFLLDLRDDLHQTIARRFCFAGSRLWSSETSLQRFVLLSLSIAAKVHGLYWHSRRFAESVHGTHQHFACTACNSLFSHSVSIEKLSIRRNYFNKGNQTDNENAFAFPVSSISRER